MFEMGLYYIFSLSYYIFHYLFLIIRFRFPFLYFYRSFRTLSYTGTDTIAEQVTYKSCFFVYNLKGALRTIRNTQAASRTFIFIDPYYFSFSHLSFLSFYKNTIITDFFHYLFILLFQAFGDSCFDR